MLISACTNPLGEKDYLDDLYVKIPSTDSEILIKEWQYLFANGAEAYYVSPEGKKLKLPGELSGGDDGYCPFRDGKYSIEYNSGNVTVRWSFDGSDDYSRSKSFVLDE